MSPVYFVPCLRRAQKTVHVDTAASAPPAVGAPIASNTEACVADVDMRTRPRDGVVRPLRKKQRERLRKIRERSARRAAVAGASGTGAGEDLDMSASPRLSSALARGLRKGRLARRSDSGGSAVNAVKHGLGALGGGGSSSGAGVV